MSRFSRVSLGLIAWLASFGCPSSRALGAAPSADSPAQGIAVPAPVLTPEPPPTPTPKADRCDSEETDGLTYRYCIYETDPALNPDILYYLHAGGGSEKSWETEENTRHLRDEWKKQNLAAPTVIIVSLGPQWLLSERQKGSVRDLHAFFVNILMTKLEAQLHQQRKGQRLLLGESMGGFNGAMLLLKNGGLFQKVALLCPGLSTIGPYSSSKEIESFIRRTGAKRERVKRILDWARSEFPTQKSWSAHDPLRLAPRQLSESSPALFLSCGTKDEYGFFEGTKKFASIAQTKGVKVRFDAPKAGHCVTNIQDLAAFLVTPQEPAKPADLPVN